MGLCDKRDNIGNRGKINDSEGCCGNWEFWVEIGIGGCCEFVYGVYDVVVVVGLMYEF